MLVNSKRYKALFQNDDSRKQQANQVHHMLPADLSVISKILFDLFELREHIGVICAVHVLGQKDIAQIDQFPCNGSARFD